MGSVASEGLARTLKKLAIAFEPIICDNSDLLKRVNLEQACYWAGEHEAATKFIGCSIEVFIPIDGVGRVMGIEKVDIERFYVSNNKRVLSPAYARLNSGLIVPIYVAQKAETKSIPFEPSMYQKEERSLHILNPF